MGIQPFEFGPGSVLFRECHIMVFIFCALVKKWNWLVIILGTVKFVYDFAVAFVSLICKLMRCLCATFLTWQYLCTIVLAKSYKWIPACALIFLHVDLRKVKQGWNEILSYLKTIIMPFFFFYKKMIIYWHTWLCTMDPFLHLDC